MDLAESVTEQLKEAEMAEWSDLAAAEQTFGAVPSMKSGELRSGNHEQIAYWPTGPTVCLWFEQ